MRDQGIEGVVELAAILLGERVFQPGFIARSGNGSLAFILDLVFAAYG